MNNRFDQATKALAESLTRREALRKFGAGLAGMALACFGLANKAQAATYQGFCQIKQVGFGPETYYSGMCMDINGCLLNASADCPVGTSAGTINKKGGGGFKDACGYLYHSGRKCSFTV
jgi:hypothetical protein